MHICHLYMNGSNSFSELTDLINPTTVPETLLQDHSRLSRWVIVSQEIHLCTETLEETCRSYSRTGTDFILATFVHVVAHVVQFVVGLGNLCTTRTHLVLLQNTRTYFTYSSENSDQNSYRTLRKEAMVLLLQICHIMCA